MAWAETISEGLPRQRTSAFLTTVDPIQRQVGTQLGYVRTSVRRTSVTAGLDVTVDALRNAGVTAVVVPLADERVAVIPDEGDRDSAPVLSIGADLSMRLGHLLWELSQW
jgi:hypothetical protein